MLKPVRSILFATDLSSNCQQALEFTIAVGASFQSTIYMIHVLEAVPDIVEGQLKNLLGRHQWEDIFHSHVSHAHSSLTGKISMNARVRQEIREFLKESGIEDKADNMQAREIIISKGDIAETIIKNAHENKCDLIVMGAKKNVFGKVSLGSNTKEVLKNGTIPVTVVPPLTPSGK